MKLQELFESHTELFDIIDRYCPKNFRHFLNGESAQLYRGIVSIDIQRANSYSYALVQPRTAPRISRTGANYFLDFVSLNKNWKDFPNRKFSTFCALRYMNAEEFIEEDDTTGTVFVIIPFDDVNKIAVIPQDFNYTHIDGFNLLTFINTLQYLLMYIHDFKDFLSDELKLKDEINKINFDEKHTFNSEQELNSFFESINRVVDVILLQDKDVFKLLQQKNVDVLLAACKNLKAKIKNQDLLSFVQHYISPEKMHAKLIDSYSKLAPSMADDSEIWFRGGYLAIEVNSSQEYKSAKFRDYFSKYIQSN